MRNKLLHVFRNTPQGREILLQSIYFCKKTKTKLKVYIPKSNQFLMYFENKVITVDLDKDFLKHKDSSKNNVESLTKKNNLVPLFLENLPEEHTSTIPNIPTDFTYMCSPRSISDLSTKIGLGHIGTKVRSIIKSSSFPILIPSTVYKEWKSITVFFGGSKNSFNVMRLGIKISLISGLPLKIFTQAEKTYKKKYYEDLIKNTIGTLEEKLILNKKNIEIDKKNLLKPFSYEWKFFENENFAENLYSVDHDSLVVIGSFGHGIIKDILFGSKMEAVQSVLPNNLLIVGPKYNSEIL